MPEDERTSNKQNTSRELRPEESDTHGEALRETAPPHNGTQSHTEDFTGLTPPTTPHRDLDDAMLRVESNQVSKAKFMPAMRTRRTQWKQQTAAIRREEYQIRHRRPAEEKE